MENWRLITKFRPRSLQNRQLEEWTLLVGPLEGEYESSLQQHGMAIDDFEVWQK